MRRDTDEQLQEIIDRGLERAKAELAAAIERRDAKLAYLYLLETQKRCGTLE